MSTNTVSIDKIVLISALLVTPSWACSDAIHELGGSGSGGAGGSLPLEPTTSGGAGDIAQECDDIGADMVALLQQNSTCTKVEDCTTVFVGGCFTQYVSADAGLAPAVCGDQPANVNILDSNIDELSQSLFNCLGSGGCVTCDLGASGATCQNGVCVALP